MEREKEAKDPDATFNVNESSTLVARAKVSMSTRAPAAAKERASLIKLAVRSTDWDCYLR